MNPSIAPTEFVKDIKVSTSIRMKRSKLFPSFNSWAVGYGSFICSYMDKDRLIEYIKNQKEYHKKISFEDEYRKLLFEYGITPDEKYFP
jgi:putative transposase